MTSRRDPDQAPSQSRLERKQRTRRALLDAALDLLCEENFSALSLRALTKRVGIVPTAFYRHFATLDELGLTLVDESFVTLRATIREIRTGDPAPKTIIDRSVEVLIAQLIAHPDHFRFIGRERHGGVEALRTSIRHELSLVEQELAIDLARMPGLERWGGVDLRLLADLFVDLMVSAAGELVSASTSQPAVRQELGEKLRNQARMVMVGAAGWEPIDG